MHRKRLDYTMSQWNQKNPLNNGFKYLFKYMLCCNLCTTILDIICYKKIMITSTFSLLKLKKTPHTVIFVWWQIHTSLEIHSLSFISFRLKCIVSSKSDWDACVKFGMGPSWLCNGWPWTKSGQPAAAYIWALWWQSGWPEKWSKNRPLYNKCPTLKL